MREEREKAVIYVPRDALEADAALCLEYAKAAGYHVVGIVVGRWNDAWTLALNGVAQVVIAAARSHLPAEWAPRLEFAGEMTHGEPTRHEHVEGPASPMRRRPQQID